MCSGGCSSNKHKQPTGNNNAGSKWQKQQQQQQCSAVQCSGRRWLSSVRGSAGAARGGRMMSQSARADDREAGVVGVSTGVQVVWTLQMLLVGPVWRRALAGRTD